MTTRSNYRLSPAGQKYVRNPARNERDQIGNEFFKTLILIFVFINGSYKPSDCKAFFEPFGVLSSADKERMRTRQYLKWKQHVDAAKQQLLNKGILVEKGAGRFEISPGKVEQMFRQVSAYLEIVEP